MPTFLQDTPQFFMQTVLPTLKPTVAIFSVAVLVWVLLEGFETLVLPRRVDRGLRLTRFFYRNLWKFWRKVSKSVGRRKQDDFLAFFGPLSLLLLLALWAETLLLAFGFFYWGIGLPVNLPAGEGAPSLGTYLYFSGVTFITLGYGDVSPQNPLGRVLANVEAGLGFGFLAIVIGYLPVLYGAFSRREAKIALLDARASSPPTAGELLRRHKGNLPELCALLRDWEMWAAEVLESHLSYPVLAYYRSQHEQQSWLNSLTLMLDACAFIIASYDDEDENDPLVWQARLTFAISRHTAVDIALVFAVEPTSMTHTRLTDDETNALIELLRGSDIKLPEAPTDRARLTELRRLYEPYVYVLSKLMLMPLPGWIPDAQQLDNWKTSSWDKSDHFFYTNGNGSNPYALPDKTTD